MGNSDSKSKFRESVYKLSNEQVSSKNIEFWDKLWKIPTTAEEIFTLIHPDDVRMLRRNQPENLKTMIQQAIYQLVQIVDTPLKQYYQQAINCVRVLTRLIPFILEKTDDEEFIRSVFWEIDKNDRINDNNNNKNEEINEIISLGHSLIYSIMGLLYLPDFTVSNDAYQLYLKQKKKKFNRSDSLPQKRKVYNDKQETKDFEQVNTEEIQDDDEINVYPCLLWSSGVGFPDVNSSRSSIYNNNRLEVLKLFLTCFSGVLYHKPDAYDQAKNKFLYTATVYPVDLNNNSNNTINDNNNNNVDLLPTLFYSLLNIISTYDPIGWGIPYFNTFLSDQSSEKLTDIAIQILLILLDFGYPVPCSVSINNNMDTIGMSTRNEMEDLILTPKIKISTIKQEKEIIADMPSVINQYRRLLANIRRTADLAFLHNNICRLLNNYFDANHTLLPNSLKQIKIQQELVVLLWKLIDENTFYLNYLLTNDNPNKLVVSLLYLMYEGRNDPTKSGLIYICTFILLRLSGERNFSVSLNEDVTKNNNSNSFSFIKDFCFFSDANYADLIIIIIHKLIISSSNHNNKNNKLSSVYTCFLTIIANISPYIKHLNMPSSVRLVRLFKYFSSTRFLYHTKYNYLLLFYLLDIFNNLIQYQYEGNSTFIYTMIQNTELFFKLHALSLPQNINLTSENNNQEEDTNDNNNNCQIVLPTDKTNEILENINNGNKNDKHDNDINNSESENEVDNNSEDIKEDQDNNNDNVKNTIADNTTATVDNNSINKFIPTETWLLSWKKKIPLETTLRLLKHLVPQIEQVNSKNKGNMDEQAILKFIKDSTMVGLLPVPHPIVIRRYQSNQFTTLWFTTFIWGVIFLRNQRFPLFDGSSIALFKINVLHWQTYFLSHENIRYQD